MTQQKRKKRSGPKRPTILVLEALSGSGDCVIAEGGDVIDAAPSNVARACEKIDSQAWDGLLLTGGGDVDPRLYGQRPRKEVYGVSENRDLVETYALEVARARDKPVLGICRGAQIINVEAGGTLKQHIPGHRGTEHAVLSRDNSIMREFAGLNPVVISLHHQRLEDIARGYSITGRASDGTIESIEDEARRVLGVQFHPEMDWLEGYAQALFRWLVVEAAVRAKLPEPERRGLEHDHFDRGYNPSKFHTIGRPGKHRGTRSRGSTYSVPTYKPKSGVSQTWVCPHCAIRFDKFEDRDDHVAFRHDGMVTPLSDEILKDLKRQSAKIGQKLLGPGDLLMSLRADVYDEVKAAVLAGWTAEQFGTGTRFVRFVSPEDPNKHFITMPAPKSQDWLGALHRSMERAGAPINKEESSVISIPSPSPSGTP